MNVNAIKSMTKLTSLRNIVGRHGNAMRLSRREAASIANGIVNVKGGLQSVNRLIGRLSGQKTWNIEGVELVKLDTTVYQNYAFIIRENPQTKI